MRYTLNMAVDGRALRGAAQRFHDRLPAIVEAATREGARKAVKYARENHPHVTRTGNLVDPRNLFFRIGKRTGRFVGFEIINKAAYAGAIEEGAPRHEIAPKHSDKRLVFKWDGAPSGIFVGRPGFAVMHPGNAPMPFMAPAVKIGKEYVITRISREIKKELHSLWRK